MTGTVKWYDAKKKGYGFIVGGDSKEYFAHWRNIVDGDKDSYKKLVEGQSVRFDASTSEKGLAAINIVVVK